MLNRLANFLPDRAHAANLDSRSRLIPFVKTLVRNHTDALAAQQQESSKDPQEGVPVMSVCMYAFRKVHGCIEDVQLEGSMFV